MITNTKQKWVTGQLVKVGFLTLRVDAIIPTPGDGKPDEYRLSSLDEKHYSFVPHNGLRLL